MEAETQQTKRLEKFITIVGLFVVFDVIFWSVFTRFLSGFFFDAPYVYQVISLIFALGFCAIPVTAGILISNQTWKILLIVIGALAFVIRVAMFSSQLFSSLW